jgi:hypothetical protein
MDDALLLPVSYQGEELEFEMKLQQGYVPRVEILIDGLPVIFETDDSGDYRALADVVLIAKHKQLSVGLLQAIAEQLELLFNPKA